MDLLLTAGTAVLGQITHVVKKKVAEGGQNELAAFHSQIIKKPFNTLAAALGAVVASTQLVDVDTMTTIQAIAMSFMTGYSADSAINRPGK